MKNILVLMVFVAMARASAQSGAAIEAQPASPAQNPPAASSIYIINGQNQKVETQAQKQINEQPVSVVEDSPLALSPAEIKRRKRQELEVKTEQEIVERLEEARMQEEKARVQKLFGGGFASGVEQKNEPKQEEKAQEVIPAALPVKEQKKTEVKSEPEVKAIAAKEVVREVPAEDDKRHHYCCLS